MKRIGNLFDTLISDENLQVAIIDVNRAHRWKANHKPNPCAAWVEETMEERIRHLRQIIVEGFEQKPPRVTQRYDASARKWRAVSEPMLWPDQYVHHALIQVIEPAMMRGMDPYCCGSIKGRGAHYAKKAISKWLIKDRKGTRHEFCGDIYHFYDSLKPEMVMDRMKSLIKDRRVLDLIWRIVKDGVMIGAYTSQWFANTLLQPMDMMIRQSGLCDHYVRYMDNITVFGPNKRKLRRLKDMVARWLDDHELKLKGDWQVFPVMDNPEKRPLNPPRRGYIRPKRRMPDAVGYRYGRGYSVPRKHNLIRMKRAVRRYRKRKEQGKKI